jgi:hypothetical protein
MVNVKWVDTNLDFRRWIFGAARPSPVQTQLGENIWQHRVLGGSFSF